MSINSINTRINAIEGLIDEISEQLDYIRTEINRLEPPSPDTPEEPSPTPTQPSTGDGPHVLTLGPKGFTYEFEVPARSFALHVKRTSVALLQKTRSISKGQYVSIDGSWADYLGHGDILVGFDIGDGRWAGASVYKSNGKIRWREYNPNMVGVLFDDEYEMDGGTLSPSNPPVVIPDPPVVEGIYRSSKPGLYFHREENGANDFGVKHAIVVAKHGMISGRTIRLFSAEMARKSAPSFTQWNSIFRTALNEGCVGYAIDMEHLIIGGGPEYCAGIYNEARKVGINLRWEPAYHYRDGFYHLSRYWKYSISDGFKWMQAHSDGVIAWKYDQTGANSIEFGKLAYRNGYTKSTVYLGDAVARQGIGLSSQDVQTLRDAQQNLAFFMSDSNGYTNLVVKSPAFKTAAAVYG